jgi:ribonuclease VapC
MIVDTSAVIAILRAEPDAADHARAIEAAHSRRMSAATLVEAGAVVDRDPDPVVRRQLDALIETAGISIEPLTEAHARVARDAYRDFGKGGGHRAGLNLGDCFSYALAKATGEPLLFKGDDFGHTDLSPALVTDATAPSTEAGP